MYGDRQSCKVFNCVKFVCPLRRSTPETSTYSMIYVISGVQGLRKKGVIMSRCPLYGTPRRVRSRLTPATSGFSPACRRPLALRPVSVGGAGQVLACTLQFVSRARASRYIPFEVLPTAARRSLPCFGLGSAALALAVRCAGLWRARRCGGTAPVGSPVGRAVPAACPRPGTATHSLGMHWSGRGGVASVSGPDPASVDNAGASRAPCWSTLSHPHPRAPLSDGRGSLRDVTRNVTGAATCSKSVRVRAILLINEGARYTARITGSGLFVPFWPQLYTL
ncbi:hypothetical protein AHF37_10102 [Paragonimus kellicotti]|nr:hypothetical protein AHF37_10102 [Paragonimus kellicotti]